MNQYYGRANWLRKGYELFGKDASNLDINEMDLKELNERKLKAETWLKENLESLSYSKALTRYELICDRIKKLENVGTAEDLL